MDLPERTLSNKISSRLGKHIVPHLSLDYLLTTLSIGLTRITFPGYNHDQLMKIIQSRLEGVPGNIVDPDAVQFASRKVAAVSGDARRALDICRRAVEIAELESQSDDNDSLPPTPSKRATKNGTMNYCPKGAKAVSKVTINTIKQAINEATTSPLQQYLRSLPLSSKLFLAATIARIRRTGISESILGDVIEEAKRIGKMADSTPIREFLLVEPLTSNMSKGVRRNDRHLQAARVLGLSTAAVELMDAGIIGVESRKGERTGRVRLSIGDEEVRLALKNDLQARGLGFST
jgi:origin recognition complex subunit 1